MSGSYLMALCVLFCGCGQVALIRLLERLRRERQERMAQLLCLRAMREAAKMIEYGVALGQRTRDKEGFSGPGVLIIRPLDRGRHAGREEVE